MTSKKTIKILLLAAVWTVIGSAVLTLLVAANGKDRAHRCSNVAITANGTGENYYIGKSDIAGMLRHAHSRPLKGEPLTVIDLAQLERRLEKNSWIKDAELYFDSRDVLHVLVTERQPVARVFTTAGTSFYLDTAGMRLPLLPQVSARVPVVTNFPAAKRWSSADSAVFASVRTIIQYVATHEFWSAQLAQIDIMPNGNFELLPLIGNHSIRIGTAENLEQKLHRLMLFYKQVAGRAGFDKYAALDVRYEGQVVAVQTDAAAAFDSVQLQKNIGELLQADQMRNAHEQANALADTDRPAPDSLQNKPAAAANSPLKNTVIPIPAKTSINAKPVKTMASKKAPVKKAVAPKPVAKKEAKKPKAVMPNRANEY